MSKNFIHAKQTRRGDQLCSEDRDHVLRAYVHRFTKEHRPQWASGTWKGRPHPVQFESDQDWLANTEFAVRRDGRIDHSINSCHSTPTWPDNPELRKT